MIVIGRAAVFWLRICRAVLVGAQKAILMITIFTECFTTVSQKLYDSVINGLSFSCLMCPCGHSGCLTVHGYYNRSVKVEGILVSLRVCRVICRECGHTHALVLSSVVPYSQILLSEQAEIVSGGSDEQVCVMERNPLIDESCVQAVLKKFKKYWKQRLETYRAPVWPLYCLVLWCFRQFGLQFMQARETANILFLIPT